MSIPYKKVLTAIAFLFTLVLLMPEDCMAQRMRHKPQEVHLQAEPRHRQEVQGPPIEEDPIAARRIERPPIQDNPQTGNPRTDSLQTGRLRIVRAIRIENRSMEGIRNPPIERSQLQPTPREKPQVARPTEALIELRIGARTGERTGTQIVLPIGM